MSESNKNQVVPASETQVSFLVENQDEGEAQGDFRVQHNLEDLIQQVENAEIDEEELNNRIKAAVDQDFPHERKFPTSKEMDLAVSKVPPHGFRFSQGDWCEYFGQDMLWHLSQIKRVIRAPPEDWTDISKVHWHFFYSFEGGNLVNRHEIRAPEEGLKRLFGFRPWLWQQWALVSFYH